MNKIRQKIKLLNARIWLRLLIITMIFGLLGIQNVRADTTDYTPNAASAILIEANGGKVIHAKNEHEKLYPASMTKMMGMLLIMEAIQNKKLHWDTMITVSEHAANMGGSQIYLEPNEQMSVDDLFKAVAIASANDAMVALGEKIAVSEENFVKMMNERAKQMGLTNTNFVNASGLHDPNHVSSAYDMAMIGRELVRVGGDTLLQYSSTYDAYIREHSDKKFWLVNTNKLIRFYEGTDGLKTGYTSDSKYCITVTTMRDGLRLIAVVMREPTSAIRNAEIRKLMDYGFALYDTIGLFVKGQEIDVLNIENGKPERVSLHVANDVKEIVLNGQNESQATYEVIIEKNVAPIAKGEVVGKVRITMVDGIVMEEDLVVMEDVLPLTYFDVLKNTLFKLMF